MPDFWESATLVREGPGGKFWEDATAVREQPWELSTPVDDVESDLRIADTQHKLKFARKRLRQSPLPDLFSALTQVTFRGVSKVQRVTGFGDADESNRISNAFESASREMDKLKPIPEFITRGIRGSAVSAPEVAIGGLVAGPVGAIAAGVAGETNQAITEGRDAGLEGADLAEYVAAAGVIEGAPAFIMQKIPGLGGLESMFGKDASRVVSRGIMDGLKRFGIGTLAELGEEVVTELGHSALSVVADVSEGALEPDAIYETVRDTVTQTLFTMGMFGGARAAGNVAASKEAKDAKAARARILEMDESGDTPSRKEWTRDLGMPASEGKTGGQRRGVLAEVASEMRRQDTEEEARQAAPEGLGAEAADETAGPLEGQGEPLADAGLQSQGPVADQPPAEPDVLPQTEEIAAPTEGEVVGLSKEAGREIRETIGAAALDEEAVQTHASVVQQAKAEQADVRAVETAESVMRARRQITTVEHAGMVIRAGELLNELDSSRGLQAEAAEAGDRTAYDAATAEDDRIVSQLDLLTEASRNSRREVARALSIGRLRLSRDKFDVASVMEQVRAAKGPSAKLTKDELQQVDRRTKEVAEIQREVEDIERQEAAAEARIDKASAEAVLKSGRKPSAGKAIKEKARAEREEIKKRIRQLGLRVNDITGVPVEGAWLLGQLGVTYIKEGAGSLTEVIEKLQQDVPHLNLTPGDVYKLLTMQNPRAKRKARTAAQKRVANIKSIARVLSELDDLSAGKAPLKRAKVKPTPELKKMQKKLTVARNLFYASEIEASKLEGAIETVNRLQDQIDNNIIARKKGVAEVPAERRAIQGHIKELREEIRIDDALAKANRQLESGIPDEKIAKEVKPVSERLQRKRIELKKAKNKVKELIHDSRPWTAGRVAEESAATLKTLKATADMSFTFRQNIWQVASHPTLAAKSFVPGWKAFLSENSAEQINDAITNESVNPNAFLYEKSGLVIMDAASTQDKNRAEVYRSSVIERSNIPILKQIGAVMKASSRHAVAVGNLMRTSAFDAFVDANPNVTDAEMRAFADYLNVSTGLGNLGRFGAVAKELNLAFFSPRYAVSRIQTPLAIFKHYEHPRVRKQIARDMTAFVATGGMVLTLAAMAGAELEWDPESADWGKIRHEDTRIDIWGGYQQPARVIARLATNPFRKDADWRPLELLGRFSAFKLAPAVTLPIELVEGKTAVGEETTATGTAARAAVPLVLEDIHDAWREGGMEMGVAVGALAFHGVGASTYRDSKTATRSKIKRLKRKEAYVPAETMRREWNKRNPRNRIVTVNLN